MAIVVDVEDAAHRLDELLAHADAGRDVVISRDRKPVAGLTKAGAHTRHEAGFDASNVIAENKKARAGIAPTTIDESLAWRDEGRR